eukprot:32783_1
MVMEIIVRWFIMCMHLILYMLGNHGWVTYKYMHYDIKTYFLQDAAAATRVCIGKVHGHGGESKSYWLWRQTILCCATKKRVVFKMKVGDKNDVGKGKGKFSCGIKQKGDGTGRKSGGKIQRW